MGRCFEGEGARSFGPWLEALGALPDVPAAPSATPAEGRTRLFDAVVHQLRAAAHERPLLLVLDDLHWADRPSLALLRHLARYVADAPILVLGTLREEELAVNEPLDELIAMLRREAPCQHITLPELGLAESSALAILVLEQRNQDQPAATLDDRLAETLLNHTGGNPFFIHETVRDLVETARIVRRQEHWAAVSPPSDWDVPLATHYRLAGRFAAPERSIDYALRAGEVAHASFAYEDAFTHWQSALDLMALHNIDAERRAALLEKLGNHLYVTDQGAERAVLFFEEALALYEQAGRSDAVAASHLHLGRLFGGANSDRQDIPRALRFARAAAAYMPPDEVSIRRAQVELLFALTSFYSLQLDEALAASQRAMNVVAKLHDHAPRIAAYVHRGFCLAAAGELSAGLALISQGHQMASRLNQPFYGALVALWGGFTRCDLLDPADASRWFTTELAQPRTANSASSRQMLAFHLARAQLMMGAVAEPTHDVPPNGVYHVTLAAAFAYIAGDWSACRAAATRLLELARRRGNRWVEFWAIHQLARLALAEHDATGAEDLLDRSLAFVAGQHRPWEALVSADLGVLYASRGRSDDARAAVDRCRASMSEQEDWRGLAGRLELAEAALAAAERRTALADEHYARAIAVFRRYHLPWDEAQALECWGATLINSGDRTTGDRRLDAAATLYRRHGAGARWLQRVARIRAAARNGQAPAASPSLPRGLSQREVEVLCLVAAGRSNQEIAEVLVLSVRTVERHLGHVYDKLGANGKSARAVATAYGIANGLVPPK